MPRLWSVAHRHGYVTPADFVARPLRLAAALALAVAITGILATMPYIALQLVGIQAVLDVLGVGGSGNCVRQGPAADHRLRRPGRLHLHLRPAGAGADRVRQGHADLRGRHRRDHLHPDPARRLRRTSSTPRRPSSTRDQPGAPASRPASLIAARRRLLGLRHAGARLGAGAVHVPALDHRRARRQAAATSIRRNAALLPALLADARASSRCSATWRIARRRSSRSASTAATRSWPCRSCSSDMFPALVRRVRLRRHRDRRAGAGRDHVDRRGQPVHPQHLQGLLQARTPRPRRRRGSPSSSRWS